MCFGQSAFFVPLVVPLLILFLHAMSDSDDDFIVGFPGETEADFEDTCEVVRQVGFSKIHMFPFSARRGTPAATMDDQVPKSEKSARGRELAEIESVLRADYFRSLQGESLRVMLEAKLADELDTFAGTSCRYAPIRVKLGENAVELGQMLDVTAGQFDGKHLLAVAD